MRKILSFFLILLWATSFAQNKKFDVRADGLFNPEQRLLYVGVDNTISINNTDTSISIALANGKFYKEKNKDSRTYYYVKESKPGKETISIQKKTKKNVIVLDTAIFTVLRVPDPVPLFGNLVDTVARVGILLLQKEIKAFCPCYFNLGFQVTSFTLTIVKPDGFFESSDAIGSLITWQQRDLIKSIKPGDWLYIENIKCRGANSCTRNLGSIKIRVV
jgi:hypothetical protein